ncbi:sigma-70 family RNA polymerase sigma factor [Singulisphaera sp. Ch08]|uniref:Sigma-70 family RNA polymerase sigma factor n=1 Tax=Singulisphaera sp. Ch08 TaxID=3120278 RepID=A0AAU7C7M4_9BACT
MVATSKVDVPDALSTLDHASTWLLGPKQERRLLEDLAECKRTLGEALAHDPSDSSPASFDDPRSLSRFIAAFYADHAPVKSPLGAHFQRYFEIREELALANMRLVASVAKRYRNRGIAYSDLVQEGFCGLLEAIDRFDTSTHQTKLSTYATWWIRQAVQSAVAEGAYPVRLAPRHLRQLAQDKEEYHQEFAQKSGPSHIAAESIQRVQAATRPTVSLDDTRLNLLQTANDSESDIGHDIDTNQIVGEWLKFLRPRERQILAYRFGLGGSPRLSLSQVGKVLDVSKERVRQIQDVALKLIRKNVASNMSLNKPEPSK